MPPAASPLDDATRSRLQRQATRDTRPELALRSELHKRGFRFRVDRSPIVGMRSRADLVFGPAKVAVFVDGCFWHRCPEHGTMPKNNRAWWEAKLGANADRDRRVGQVLVAAGWQVIRVWEHEDPLRAADEVAAVVRERRSR